MALYNPFTNLFTVYNPTENTSVEYKDFFTDKTTKFDWASDISPSGVITVKDNLPDRESLSEPSFTMSPPKSENTKVENLETPRQHLEKAETEMKQTSSTSLGKKALNFFINKGLSNHAAAGIVGNLILESNLNTSANGDNGTAYGIALWRLDRRTGLENFAKKKGTSISDFDTLLEYVWLELNTRYKTALNKLINSNNIDLATSIFMLHYEKPNIKYANLNKRIQNAKSILS